MTGIETERLAVFFLGYAIILFSLIPLIRSDYWLIRIFDYPRSQKFWITATLIVIFITLIDWSDLHHKVFLGLMFLNLIYLLRLIWDYTPLASIQLKRNRSKAGESGIRIFIANVYQENEEYDRCRRLIHKYDPDIVLLVETNEKWLHSLKLDGFPFQVLQPQENTYGMLLYSRLKIVDYEIRFLVAQDIPSISADIETKDGKQFKLYCLHPRPPVPPESDESTKRDAEILMIGKEVRKCTDPVIVAGDLNDVAWSYTTNLFLKVSSLLDPRIGRGFFSTFNANYRLFRWPLDHVFCSAHFFLCKLVRLPSIGSDHFPIFIEVALMAQEIAANQSEVKEAAPEDFALANEKIADAQQ